MPLTLDSYDRIDDRPQTRPKPGHGTGENLKVIGNSWCWCGKAFGHAYPGRNQGKPHPSTRIRMYV